jgi:hypothetical protein
MAGRTLRNCTVEASQDDETISQQCESDWPEDQPQHVGSECELGEVTEAPDIQSDMSEATAEAHRENAKADSAEELKNMMASMLAVI